MQLDVHWDRIVKAICSAVGTAATWFWGGWDNALILLALLMAFDYIFGVAAAFKEKKVDSRVGFWGIVTKVGMLVLVGIGNVMDKTVFADAPIARSIIIFWFIGNEGISLLENLGRLGVSYPPWLHDALVQLKKRGEGQNVQQV